MTKSSSLGIRYAVIALALLVISMGILYPLTRSVILWHMPIMTWGFLILGLFIVIQGYAFLFKIEQIEKQEEGQKGGSA